MHHLAGIGDDGIVLLRGGAHHIGTAQVPGHPLHQRKMLRLGPLVRGEDVVGPLEHVGQGVLNAGKFSACHGVPS